MPNHHSKHLEATRHLRHRYIAILATIAALLLIGQLFTQLALRNQGDSSSFLRAADRQMLYCRQVVPLSKNIYYTNDPELRYLYRDELLNILKQLKLHQEALREEAKGFGLATSEDPTILADLAQAEASLNAIDRSALALLSADSAGNLGAKAFRDQLTALQEREAIYLDSMEQLLQSYEKMTREKSTTIFFLELVLVFLVLFALYMLTIIVFRPAESKIHAFLKEIHEEKELLQHHATYDEATGLLNRHTGLMILKKEMAHAKRKDGDLIIICAEIDGIKEINEAHSYKEGDWLIKNLAVILSKVIRESDTAFRFGGDEFFMILPDATTEQAEAVLARIQEAISKLNQESGKPFFLSISTGMAAYRQVLPAMADYFTSYADQKMLENKQAKKTASK